jgi:hypothetical protein
VADSWEHSISALGSTMYGEILEYLSDWWLLKDSAPCRQLHLVSEHKALRSVNEKLLRCHFAFISF